MRTIDTAEYVSILRELTEKGESASMLITGSSMSPFLIHKRDYIYFEKPRRDLRKGDMVFYQRDDGRFIMHRICRVNKDGSYNIVGDNQTFIEKGIRRDQIFALVTQVKRKGHLEGPGSFWWEFFEKIWIRIIPLRPAIRRIYGVIDRFKKSDSSKKHNSSNKKSGE